MCWCDHMLLWFCYVFVSVSLRRSNVCACASVFFLPPFSLPYPPSPLSPTHPPYLPSPTHLHPLSPSSPSLLTLPPTHPPSYPPTLLTGNCSGRTVARLHPRRCELLRKHNPILPHHYPLPCTGCGRGCGGWRAGVPGGGGCHGDSDGVVPEGLHQEESSGGQPAHHVGDMGGQHGRRVQAR